MKLRPTKQDVILNHTYTFKCDATFGTLSKERVYKLFTDGRRASGFLELQLEDWFEGLEFVDGKGYDHINHLVEGQLYDAKCFTRHGAKFCSSKYLGVGRSLDVKEHEAHAENIIYIFTDVVSFPEVRVRFVKGSDLIQTYKKGSIPFSHRDDLFE
tara:strand:+ start:8363 stop:8830 length:468 start_codon:yes stop_codon:yes gene_type:complete